MSVTVPIAASARTGQRTPPRRRFPGWRRRPRHERFCLAVAAAAFLLFPVRLFLTLVIGALL
jgi:hypothetical protein